MNVQPSVLNPAGSGLSPRGDDPARFGAAIRRLDEENLRDPNRVVTAEGEAVPYELFYAQHVTKWVLQLCPEASEALFLAARSQHICRWMIPRGAYEMNRAGYLKWRTDLKEFHAIKSAEILADVGYPIELIERVQALNLKKNLGKDPEVQVLEDALCLVTLQHQLADLMRKTERTKLLGILQKTWRKMSSAAREAAFGLDYSGAERALIEEALAPPNEG